MSVGAALIESKYSDCGMVRFFRLVACLNMPEWCAKIKESRREIAGTVDPANVIRI